jgi:predicted acylesterase/phospholipase RssA
MLTAIVQPNRVSDVINKDLGGISIDETDVRFVAVTTALLEDDPPQTRAVSSGTLGEAAQASGAAPLLFKPVQVGDERFSDGASASLVPVRILKDCGADFVFGFNCLPGPPRRNPIDHRPGGQMLYERTAVGRLIDLWVSSGSMMQRLSREACEDAHVYFEPENDELFLIESVQFWKAREIEKKGADGVPPAVNDCVTMWKRLRR